MSHVRRCPKCGNEMPSPTASGVCPKCLLSAGLEAQSEVDPSFAPTMDSPRSGDCFVPPVPEELAARFPNLEILELLGKGGMGAVYKARQRGLNRLVALKILPPEVGRDPTFAQRFEREAQALGRLNHPNVVTVYDFGQTDGLYFFLMEYVDGVNLRQAIKAGSMTPEAALAVIPQVCDALQYAHDEGVVHRDIKPENILLDRRGRAKIADFGLAKLLAHDPSEVHLTQTHQIMGTLRYMAPEQMEGTHQVDHRADIYSLGVVFYELLTGELPIGRFAAPSKKVHIDVRLDEVVLRALEKEPELRYQQVSEVKMDVEAIYRDLPPSVQMALGREYKSKITIFGLPLVHIAMGIDARTGKKHIAKGILAIGDVAVGVIAIGGAAFGGLAMGGAALGLISTGGLAVGLLAAVGGCAIGAFSFGGLAIGGIALGGMSIGYYAYGGGVVGMYTMSGAGAHPEARRLFEPWAHAWINWMTWMGILFPLGFGLLSALIWLVFWRQAKAGCQAGVNSSANFASAVKAASIARDVAREKSGSAYAVFAETPAPTAYHAPVRRPWMVPVLATINIIGAMLLMLISSAGDITQYEDKFWVVWEQVDMALSFIMAASLFLASIGLYLWQPWARKAIVAVSVLGLLSFVIDMPFLTRAVIPHFVAEMQAEGVLADAGIADPVDQEAAAFLMVMGLVGTGFTIWLVWMIGLLVYFTRPHVVAAFEGRSLPPARLSA